MDSVAHLIVGLGNPGPEYERTRHNVGFRVAELVAERAGARFRTSRHQSMVAEGRDEDGARLIVAKPLTYMNESGRAIASLCRYFDIEPERVVLAYDDLDLEFARLRVRKGGGTAGHNGLRSIVAALGSPEFVRVRVGIGRPPGRQDPADFVLKPFGKREEEPIAVAVAEAADAVFVVVREGVAEAQNRYNASRDA